MLEYVRSLHLVISKIELSFEISTGVVVVIVVLIVDVVLVEVVRVLVVTLFWIYLFENRLIYHFELLIIVKDFNFERFLRAVTGIRF